MSAELNSKISRDWFDMKGTLTASDPPLHLVGTETTVFPEIVDFLEKFAENGLIEAKRALFDHLFSQIKELQFHAIPKKEFIPLKQEAASLVLCTWLERALLEGFIRPPESGNTGAAEQEKLDLKEIIVEINLFAKNNPKMLQSGGKINKIIKLIKVMQEEQQKTREILSHPENLERKETIITNFRTRYSELDQNIRQIFTTFKQELELKNGTGPKQPLFKQIDRASLKKNILHQLRQSLEIYSSLDFASSISSGIAEVYKSLLYKTNEIEAPLKSEPGIIKRALIEATDSTQVESQVVTIQNELRFSLMEWLRARNPENNA